MEQWYEGGDVMKWLRNAGWTLVGVVLGALVTMGGALLAQPYPADIQLAVTNLTTGVTPFTDLGVVANGYINFGILRTAAGYGIRDNSGTLQFKNSGGAWGSLGGGDMTATYILQTTDAALPNAQILASLSSGLLFTTTGTGVLTNYAGTTCTNQFVRSLSTLGVATCNAVNLGTDTTGFVASARGGTGIDNTTWNGVAVNTFGSWAPWSGGICGPTLVLTAITIPGGVTCGQVTSAMVNTTIPITGVDINTSSQVIATHLASALPAIQGGTGLASFGIGGILYANTTTTLAALSPPGTGNFLRTAGVATAPVWSTLTLPNAATQGDLFYASAANTVANLGIGAIGSVVISQGVSPTLPVWSTILLPNGTNPGDILMGSIVANTVQRFADVTAGQVLISGGVGLLPVWGFSVNVWNAATYQSEGAVGFGGTPVTVIPPIVLSNVGGYGPITSTNAETYFAIGADGLIPAGYINSSKSHVSISFRGIYGVNGATDTMILRAKLCTVSGCGSGNVVPIAATAAIGPGATVSSQGWWTSIEFHAVTTGATAQVLCEGLTALSLTTATSAPLFMMVNTPSITVDLTQTEYISLSVQFNNNSAANTIQVYDFVAHVY